MRIMDKIILNRLISIIMNFILGVIKIISPQSEDKKPRHKILPRKRKNE